MNSNVNCPDLLDDISFITNENSIRYYRLVVILLARSNYRLSSFLRRATKSLVTVLSNHDMDI